MQKGKYNPEGIDLSKGKMVQRAGYVKGTFITELEQLSDIIMNGSYVEIKAQSMKNNGVQTMDLTVHFVPEK
jgi:hypothetical protein